MRKLTRVLSVFVIIFFIWNIYIYFTSRDTSELAVRGSISDSISCEGQIIKTETLVAAPADGVLQPYLAECAKSANGEELGAMLSGEADETARKQLLKIKSRIKNLEDSVSENGFEDESLTIDSSFNENIKQIVKNSANGKMDASSGAKDNLIYAADRHAAAKGGANSVLGTLKTKQQELESRLGNLITEVTAPCSGLFSMNIDGIEGKFTPDNIKDLTVYNLDEIKKAKSTSGGRAARGDTVCKIIDNFKWYLAVPLRSDEVGDMKTGDTVNIVFRDANGEAATAKIYNIGEDTDGKRVVSFELNRDIQGILSKRHASVDIVRKTYEGLKVPVSALCYENDETGVYVDKGGARVFKPVEVLYHNDEYMIVREDNSASNSLLLYDKVIKSKEG